MHLVLFGQVFVLTHFPDDIVSNHVNKFNFSHLALCRFNLKSKFQLWTYWIWLVAQQQNKQEEKKKQGLCCPRCTPLQSMCSSPYPGWKRLRVAPVLVSMATAPPEPNSPICHGCQPADGSVCVSAQRSVCSSVHLSSRSVSVSLCCWNARGNAGPSAVWRAKNTETFPFKPPHKKTKRKTGLLTHLWTKTNNDSF